jgi:hypothetical protein
MKHTILFLSLLALFACKSNFQEDLENLDSQGRELETKIVKVNNLLADDMKVNKYYTYQSSIILAGYSYDSIGIDTAYIKNISTTTSYPVPDPFDWNSEIPLQDGKNHICSFIKNTQGTLATDCIDVYKSLTPMVSTGDIPLTTSSGTQVCGNFNDTHLICSRSQNDNIITAAYSLTDFSLVNKSQMPLLDGITQIEGLISGEDIYLFNIFNSNSTAYTNSLYIDLETAGYSANFNSFQNTYPVSGRKFIKYNGKIYLIGGATNPSHIQIYNPTTQNWETDPILPGTPSIERVLHNLIPTSAGILIINGSTQTGAFLDTIQLYNPENNTLSYIGKNPFPKYGASAFIHENYVYFIGGNNPNSPYITRLDTDTFKMEIAGYTDFPKILKQTFFNFNNTFYMIGGINIETNQDFPFLFTFSPPAE